LAELASILRPGGRLGLLVPAHPALFGSLDRAYGHERRYTRGVLTHLVERAGLEILDLYSFNLIGVPGWWLKNRLRAPRIGHSSLAAFDQVLRFWRPIERRYRPPFGLSLVVHAARPWSRGRAGL